MTTSSAKIIDWEEKYWEIWEKDGDLTHIDDDILAFIRSLLKEATKETKNICKKIYVENVDWSEWAISDKEAGEDFEEYFKEALNET